MRTSYSVAKKSDMMGGEFFFFVHVLFQFGWFCSVSSDKASTSSGETFFILHWDGVRKIPVSKQVGTPKEEGRYPTRSLFHIARVGPESFGRGRTSVLIWRDPGRAVNGGREGDFRNCLSLPGSSRTFSSGSVRLDPPGTYIRVSNTSPSDKVRLDP